MSIIPAELQWLITLFVGGLCAYFGAMRSVDVRLTKLETLMQNLRDDFDSDHGKLDTLTERVRTRADDLARVVETRNRQGR